MKLTRLEAESSFAKAVAFSNALVEDGNNSALERLSSDFGHYDGLPAKIALLPDGRRATLIEPIAYSQSEDQSWPVPAGSELDGASIPRVLWSSIGGPFEGKYRDASIIHDHYCQVKSRPWQHTHRMFHDGMRCSGVGKTKAAIMFYAVSRFGPRWPEPTLEVVELAVSASLPTDRDAPSFVADAEAIAFHGLDIDAISVLAEARRAMLSAQPLEGFQQQDDRARLLVVAGGSGGLEDMAAIAAHAANLPTRVVDHFFDAGIRIVACRGSVTDFETDLRGVVPRGWEKTKRTWDDVPGTYIENRKRVVIATSDGLDRRVVPDKSTGLHGSDSLVVHESLHGYDYSLNHAPLTDPRFLAARDHDLSGLTDYERQAGRAGLEETFAETGAQFCVAPDALSTRCKRLATYWETAVGAVQKAVAPSPLEGMEDSSGPLGTATRGAGGRITLDLRATGPGGAIDHAALIIEPEDPAHAALDAELFSKAAGPLEGEASNTVLFFG